MPNSLRFLYHSFVYLFFFFSLGCTQSNVETTDKEMSIKSANEALLELKNGNTRFIEKRTVNADYLNQIKHTSASQHPHSFILSCIDSRIPPEIIFDQGIGNIFVARVAGNIESTHILGSMEYAVAIKHVKLIVVMGHGNCGAVNGALDGVRLDHLSAIMDDITPSLKQDKKVRENDVTLTALNNIRKTINDIEQNSPIVKTAIAQKKLELIGAYYDVKSGEVRFI